MVGAVPDRHRAAVRQWPAGWRAGRATSRWPAAPQDVAPLEMTKWFDTNYHYLVPELGPGHRRSPLDSTKPVARVRARPSRSDSPPGRCSSGRSRSCCWPSRHPASPPTFDPLTPAGPAAAGLRRAAGRPARGRRASGCSSTSPRWSQDRTPAELNAAATAPTGAWPALDRPAEAAGRLVLRPARRGAAGAGQGPGRGAGAGLHRAGRREPAGPGRASAGCPASAWSPGVVDGRNVWLNDLSRRWPPSAPCSAWPTGSTWPPPARCCTCRWTSTPSATSTRRSRRWLAFARQKTDEIVTLARGLAEGTGRHRRRTRRQPRPHLASRADLADHPRPGRPRPGRRRHRRRRAPRQPLRRARRRPSGRGWRCRCCRPPPSARSRRPPSCARPAPTCAPAGSTRPGTRTRSRPRSHG